MRTKGLKICCFYKMNVILNRLINDKIQACRQGTNKRLYFFHDDESGKSVKAIEMTREDEEHVFDIILGGIKKEDARTFSELEKLIQTDEDLFKKSLVTSIRFRTITFVEAIKLTGNDASPWLGKVSDYAVRPPLNEDCDFHVLEQSNYNLQQRSNIIHNLTTIIRNYK